MRKRTQRRFDAVCAATSVTSAFAVAITAAFTKPDRFDAVFWPVMAAFWCTNWWLATRRRTR